MEAIWSAIHVVLPSLQLTCDMVNCLGERSLFSSSFVVVFWQFLPSYAPIMLYNICYWLFFLSQGNWWTKYLAYPKIWRPKPCLLMFVSLVALNSFHLLLSNQLTANLTPEWSGRSMFRLLSHIYTKIPFCCVETVANNTLNRQRVFVVDQLWENTAHALNTAFSLTNVHAKWWIHCLLISLILCYLTRLQFTIGQNKFMEYFGVFRDNCWILGNLSIQHHLCLYNHI